MSDLSDSRALTFTTHCHDPTVHARHSPTPRFAGDFRGSLPFHQRAVPTPPRQCQDVRPDKQSAESCAAAAVATVGPATRTLANQNKNCARMMAPSARDFVHTEYLLWLLPVAFSVCPLLFNLDRSQVSVDNNRLSSVYVSFVSSGHYIDELVRAISSLTLLKSKLLEPLSLTAHLSLGTGTTTRRRC